MISIYKNDIGNIVMVFTDESQKQLKDTLTNVLEELRIVASGDVVTNVDADLCGAAIGELQMLFGELIGKKEKKSQAKASIEHMQGYLNATSQTDDGMVYRKENWENADPDEIIYIGENGLCDIMQYVENGEVKTDDELVELNIASTKNSIRETIKEIYPDATDEWIDKHDLITHIVQCCSWEYASTIIDQMSEWDDIWDDYPE